MAMNIANRFGPGVLLEVLKFAEDKSVVARELVQAVHRSNHGYTQWTGALVAIHDPMVIASFISERSDELQFRYDVFVQAQMKSVQVRFESRYRDKPSDFGCDIRRAQGLLAALLVAPSAQAGFDAFVATERSLDMNEMGRVSGLLVTSSASVKAWFGPDPRMPQPGDSWVVGYDDPERLNIHRTLDRQTQFVFPNMVLDANFFTPPELQ